MFFQPRTTKVIETTFLFYEKKGTSRYAAYTGAFLIALSYALYNDLVLGRSQESIAYECAILTACLLLLIPIVAEILVVDNTYAQSLRSSQFILFAIMTIILLLGTFYYSLFTIAKLKSDLRSKEMEIEKAMEELESLESAQNIMSDRIAVKVLMTDSVFLFEGNLTLKLNDIEVDKESNSHIVTVLIASPGQEEMEVRGLEGVDLITYGSQESQFVIQIVKVEGNSAVFFASKVKK